MADIALMMTGAVLLMNGLVLLGAAEARTVAIINIWGGLLQTVAPFVLLAQSHTSHQALAVGPPFLFGLTFLWVGLTSLTGYSQVGIGLYCMWVVPMTMVFSAVSYSTFHDPNFAVIWLNYGLLWGLFAAVLGFGRTGWARFTGWSAVVMSLWAVSSPAVLELVNDWSKLPGWTALVATAVAEAVAAGLTVTNAQVPAAPVDLTGVLNEPDAPVVTAVDLIGAETYPPGVTTRAVQR